MSDKFVTVANYYQSFVAQLAKNLLENEGIDSMLTGELASEGAFGRALGDQIVLQVHEEDAQRAASILATAEAAHLDEDWEEQAESGANVWVCSICGEPVSNHLSRCYSCETPRDSIRASAARDHTAIQPDLATLPTGEEVQVRDEIADAPSLAPTPPPLLPRTPEPKEIDEPSPMAIGDDLARRACIASLFFVLMPISWYYLVRLMFHSGELSQKGFRYFYGALLVNGLIAVLVVVTYVGLVRLH
jgi:Putative prokaryotic signal transducing protein